jgi:hypothetical protein
MKNLPKVAQMKIEDEEHGMVKVKNDDNDWDGVSI